MQNTYTGDEIAIPTSIFIYATSLPFSLGLLTSIFVIFPLVERITNAKQVQIMTGISGYTYWLSNLIWDQCIYFASAGLMIVLLYVLDTGGVVTNFGAMGGIILMTFLYGIAGTLFSYLFTFSFKTSATGFAAVIVINLFSAWIMAILTYTLRLGKTDGLILASDILRYIFSPLAIFTYARGLLDLIDVRIYWLLSNELTCLLISPTFQVADGNNICYNILDPDALAKLCQSFIDKPEGLAISSTNRLVAGCCQEPFVPADVTVCGPDTQLPSPANGTFVSAATTSEDVLFYMSSLANEGRV